MIITLFFYSCAKEKSVLICGDRECVNKTEAKQYFEENLTLEIQIVSKEKKTSYDLIDLNLGDENRKIKVEKSKNNKIVRKLSKKEIRAKKAEMYKKRKFSKQKDEKMGKITKEKSVKKIITKKQSLDNSLDICFKLDKCDIDSITSYLIKVSNEKGYPNISVKE